MDKARSDKRSMILNINQPLHVIPSVHANRLTVNEHPAVRDVFGMKKVFDGTAGGKGFGANCTSVGDSRSEKEAE